MLASEFFMIKYACS